MGLVREDLPDPLSYYQNELQGGLKGRGVWRTGYCPLHEGWSLRVNTRTGAFACMGCGGLSGGDILSFHMQVHHMEFHEACKALGAWLFDVAEPVATRATPLSPRQAIQMLELEATLVAVEGARVANGHALNDTDKDRVLRAAGRIGKIAGMFCK